MYRRDDDAAMTAATTAEYDRLYPINALRNLALDQVRRGSRGGSEGVQRGSRGGPEGRWTRCGGTGGGSPPSQRMAA
eukprot:8681167-Pyramimonas_sp.AAC.1